MTRPVSVNAPKVEAYIRIAYDQLKRIAVARQQLVAAVQACEAESPPVVFAGGVSALGASAAVMITKLDESARRLQTAINEAGEHKDSQVRLADNTADRFSDVRLDHVAITPPQEGLHV